MTVKGGQKLNIADTSAQDVQLEPRDLVLQRLASVLRPTHAKLRVGELDRRARADLNIGHSDPQPTDPRAGRSFLP